MTALSGDSRLVSLLSTGLLFGLIVLGGPLEAKAQQPPSDRDVLDEAVRVLPSMQEAPPSVRQNVERAFHGPDGTGKDGPMAAVGRDLILLHLQYEANGPAGVTKLMGRAEQVKTDRATGPQAHSPVSANGRFVTVDVVANDNPSTLLGDLERIGLKGGATAGNLVSGRLPIANIETAAALGTLRGMQASSARTHGLNAVSGADSTSLVISEADTTHSTVSSRETLGVDGSGEKICALSDSYDNLGDASTNVSNGELPGSNNPFGHTTAVDVLDDSQSESDEGRAMLQLIYDIAFGAELGFHTAFGGRANFAEGIRELANAGCTVIVDDVGYATQPFYQDGVVANAVDDVVNNDDVAYFSSAGNSGKNSYEAPFRNSGVNGVLNSSSVRHNFASSGTDTEQQITINDGATLKIFTFQWTDPTAEVSGSSGPDTDLDIALLDENGTVVASGQNDNVTLGIPVESLSHTNNTGSSSTYNLVIEKRDGDPEPDQVKYIYQGSGYTIDEYDTKGPTIYGHPMAVGAEAIAAVPFYYTSAYDSDGDHNDLPWLEPFSSKGGIKIRFDQSGNELSTFETRDKPDLTGTDGNDNTFFGSDATGSSQHDPDTAPNFFGTSAAAPNVAAIAALVREQNPSYTSSDVYSHLESNAKDVTQRINSSNSLETIASGEDPWSGHGFVQGDATALPVELAGFDAVAERDEAVLEWTTTTETNNAGFLVEHRRGDDGVFRELGFVASKADDGTTTETTTYRFHTSDLRVGTHTFRLRQQDLDGAETLSRTETVEVSLSGGHRVSSVAPNPHRKRGTVSVTVGTTQRVQAAVYNMLGQRVAVLHDGSLAADDPKTLEVGPNLQSGVYVLRVEGASFSTTRKFVRVR